MMDASDSTVTLSTYTGKRLYPSEEDIVHKRPPGFQSPIPIPPVALLTNGPRSTSKPLAKPWDPREANLVTYELNHLHPSILISRIQKVKDMRSRSFEERPMFPYSNGEGKKWKDEFTTDFALRQAPFLHLHRPLPPPYPLPAFEVEETIDDFLSSTSVKKQPSFARELSGQPHYNADKLDKERKAALLKRRVAKTKINIHLKRRNLERQSMLLAQQLKDWETHLRQISEHGLREHFRNQEILEAVDSKHNCSRKSKKIPVEESLKLAPIDYPIREDLLLKMLDDIRKQGLKVGFGNTAYIKSPPKGEYPLPNRTVEIAEAEIEQFSHPFKMTKPTKPMGRMAKK